MATGDHRHGYGSFAGSMSEGMKAEEVFVQWCASKGYETLKATSNDNRTAHVDFRVTDSATGKHVWVDVKSSKRRSRGDDTVGEYVWLELFGVSHKGWVFGKADFITVLEPHGAWLLLPREELAKYAMKQVPEPTDGGVVVTEVDKATETNLYQRKGNEKLLLAKTSSLRELSVPSLF